MTTQMTGLISYVLLTFGIAWGLWAPLARRKLDPNSMKFQLAILPGAFAPAIAASIVRGCITSEGFALADFIPRLQAWPVYLAAWLVPGVIALATYLAVRVSRWSAYPSEVRPLRSRAKTLLVLPVVALIMAPLQFGEEFGWRVFFQRSLLPDAPMLAAIVTGAIWAVWHWPLIRIGYGYPTERGKGFAAFTLWSILLSVFLGWVHAKTGDVWGVSLAHMAGNAIGGSTLAVLLPGDQKRHLVDYGGVLSSAILGVVCLILILAGAMPW